MESAFYSRTWCLILGVLIVDNFPSSLAANRTFSIDFENDQFLKDGQPFRYVSGSVHYFRMVEGSWDSTLKKMRLGGLNAIEM